jgi:4-hydroxymandelate oxidase
MITAPLAIADHSHKQKLYGRPSNVTRRRVAPPEGSVVADKGSHSRATWGIPATAAVSEGVKPTERVITIPTDIERLADYERHAAFCLAPDAWRHIQDGDDRGLTLAANRDAFDRLRLLPRVLCDLRGGGTEIDLFGARHAAPILLAPIAYQRIAHPEGELATIRAATALGVGVVLSTLSSVALEDVAAAGRQAARELDAAAAAPWFQLYLQEDRGWSAELVRRAEAAGYGAIVLTVDAAIKRASFVLPEGVDAANLRGMPRLTHTTRAGGRILFGTPLLETAPTWDDLAWVRSLTTLPLILKGVLAPADAQRAIALGCDGLVISNHGGRVLDGLALPIEMMPAIVDAVAGRVPLLLDGGVRSGSDVFRAVALGASAVLIGRPQMHALAVAGMAGVAHMLHILRAEFEFAMAQTGCRTVAEIDRDRLVQ